MSVPQKIYLCHVPGHWDTTFITGTISPKRGLIYIRGVPLGGFHIVPEPTEHDKREQDVRLKRG